MLLMCKKKLFTQKTERKIGNGFKLKASDGALKINRNVQFSVTSRNINHLYVQAANSLCWEHKQI